MKECKVSKKYSIVIGNRNAFYRTAGYKAPHDVRITLSSLGFESVFFDGNSGIKLVSLLQIMLRLVKFGFHLRKDDILFVQYPSYPLLFVVMPFFLHCRNRVVLIHDFHSLRLRGRMSLLEKLNIRFFNKVIVHTRNMKDYLSTLYPGKQYYVLGCFGYMLERSNGGDGRSQREDRRTLSAEICFAGNLDKSVFVRRLVAENGIGCKYHLYGNLKTMGSVDAPNIIYEGVFHPDTVGCLKGSWGLVWDGDSTSSCDGFLGEYLKIIAPHKFSLYIAVGLPVIVWSGSAMADVVRNKNIGIVINSLYDLKAKIESISQGEYQSMIKNVHEFGLQVRDNLMLKIVMSDVMG